MRRRALITLVLLSLGSALALGPAAATGSSYTVSVGGSSAAGPHPITATSTGLVAWGTPSFNLTCVGANIPSAPSSSAHSGSGVVDVLSIAKVNWVGCTGPGGALSLQSGGWAFHGTSGASTGSADVVAGHVDQVQITISNAVCLFTVTGEASATFDEATQRLVVAETGYTGHLVVSGVRGCWGAVSNGQAFNLTIPWSLSSADGAINLS